MEIVEQVMEFLEYISLFLCLIGCLLITKSIVRSYFFLLLLLEVSSFLIVQNHGLIPSIYILHLLFLTYLYQSRQYLSPNRKPLIIWGVLFCIIIFLVSISYAGIDPLYWWSRLITNGIIFFYSLLYWVRIYLKDAGGKSFFLLNTAIFLFFGIDLFLAIASDFLFSASVNLVVGFWFFRAILLQVYYLALIYFNRERMVEVEASPTKLRTS